MVVGVFIPAIGTFEFSFRENGPLWQIIAFRTLVRDYRVCEFRIAVVAFQNPFGHKAQRYSAGNFLKIRKIIYPSLVLSGRYRTERAGEEWG